MRDNFNSYLVPFYHEFEGTALSIKEDSQCSDWSHKKSHVIALNSYKIKIPVKREICEIYQTDDIPCYQALDSVVYLLLVFHLQYIYRNFPNKNHHHEIYDYIKNLIYGYISDLSRNFFMIHCDKKIVFWENSYFPLGFQFF